MKKYYCTYFDRNYLIKGIALIESLKKHEKDGFCLFAVCLDEISRLILEKLSFKNVKTIAMHQIEQGDLALLAAKRNRSLIEYYWTTTPTIILRILQRNPHVEILTYLDADLYFFSSPRPILDELGENSVLIHGHRFSPRQRFLERYGKYNVGLLCFRNNGSGIEVLKWWRDRCLEWCYGRFENGKYADQLYLDQWPERFDGIGVLENIGAGVAPWNHDQYSYSQDSTGTVLVDEIPLIFYHFHGLELVTPDIIVPVKYTNHPLKEEIIHHCFLHYIRNLRRAEEVVRSVSSGFSFGLRVKDLLSTKHTFLAKREHYDTLKVLGMPRLKLEGNWDCYCSLQLEEFSEVISEIEKLQDKGRIQEAGEVISKGLRRFPDSVTLLNLEAELMFLKGHRIEARDMFLDLLRRWPTQSRLHNNLGVIFSEEGDICKGVEYLSKALQIDPNDRDTTLNCGDLLKTLGKVEEAKYLYSSFLSRNPNDKVLARALASLQ